MRPPIVTSADREWALAQKPEWAPLHDDDNDLPEIADDGGWLDAEPQSKNTGPSWFNFVTGEIEAFERFFSGDLKTYGEWSHLWRVTWWPKRREDWTFKMAKRKTEPFYRKGTQEFAIALKLATADEKRMWIRFGIAQLKPGDPRVKKITDGASKRMSGEAA